MHRTTLRTQDCPSAPKETRLSRTLKQEAGSRRQPGHALAGSNDPCACAVESQLSHPTVGIPIGSAISCSRTFYLQKTQQKTSSLAPSTLALLGLALLRNLVVIINYRDCHRVHLAPAVSLCISLVSCPSQPTQHLGGPNNPEAAPSKRGDDRSRNRSQSRPASCAPNDSLPGSPERQSFFFLFDLLDFLCLCCVLNKRSKERQISNPNRHSFSASHPLAADWVCPAWTPTLPASPRRWRVHRTATSTYPFSSNMLLTQSLTPACGPSCGLVWRSQ